MDKFALLNKIGLRTDLPILKAGMKVRVWQKIKEADKVSVRGLQALVPGKTLSATLTHAESARLFAEAVVPDLHRDFIIHNGPPSC